MRRSRKSRRRPAKTYTITYLLSHQPKGIEKHEYYRLMVTYHRRSPRLKGLRFERRCYRLLQKARIKPENLHHFYRTYHLPADPFFPLFLSIRRNYLDERARIKQEKERFIVQKMGTLPVGIRRALRFLAELEQSLNHSARYPVWVGHVFPATKKRVREYAAYTQLQWIALYRAHLELLVERYRRFGRRTARDALACLILGCLPSKEGPIPAAGGRLTAGFSAPQEGEVKRCFRRLSKEHHPDSGGNSDLFVHVKWARDILLGEKLE